MANPPLKNGVVVLDDNGLVLDVYRVQDKRSEADIQWYPGVIVPGMINAHCHLELSHLKDKIESGTGLLHFIGQVVQMRHFEQEEIQAAIVHADKEMYDAGIVAVGDISNSTDTLAMKEKSGMYYHTFVEMFDLLQDFMTDQSFEQYKAVWEAFHTAKNQSKSASPHAGYSVSRALFQKINSLNGDRQTTVTMHNQEMKEEDALFENKSGGLLEFYASLDLSLDHFKLTGKSALQSVLPAMDAHHRTVLVHNTYTTAEDVSFAEGWGEVYWASCPNANLYIENRLPDYNMLREQGATVCLGTDSLCSNWQLSIVEEMKTLYKFNSYIPLMDILQWATINGAKALGISDKYGTIEKGKSPGLVHLNMNWEHPKSLLDMQDYGRLD